MDLVQVKDLGLVRSKYIEVIEKTPDLAKHAKWIYGQHPNDELLGKYISDGEMYFLMQKESVAGLIVVSDCQGKDYETVKWEIDLKNNEVSVLHLLAVCPDFQGKGVSKELIEKSVEFSKKKGKKAVRLDTLASNIPAQHMYEKYGFKYCGKQNLYAENTGFTDFMYYELIL